MPFLVASKEAGGLELSTAEVGIVYGTIGVIFLTVGGILGGLFASRIGLKKSIWWMAGCMTLPCLTFVYLAIGQPDNLFAISTAIAIEQFGYGFGFTAYMLYMMYFSEGEFKTVALCHLYRLHGTEHDDSGHVCRLPSGSSRLCQLLLDRNTLLCRHYCGHGVCLTGRLTRHTGRSDK